MLPTVYAIHENPDWWPPFAAAFEREGVPVEQWLLTGSGRLDLDAEPRTCATDDVHRKVASQEGRARVGSNHRPAD